MSISSPKSLRTGFTTGTCAAAASAAAIDTFLGNKKDFTYIQLPSGQTVRLPVYMVWNDSINNRVIARVRKDGGDDPDVTNGALIGAELTFVESNANSVCLKGGKGVGVVTRPGLSVAVGKPAINPVPQRMIINEILTRLATHPAKRYSVTVRVFVDNGEELAKKTMNPRLGIVGGISILGTTGIVKPFSAKSYMDTIDVCLKMAGAADSKTCVLSTGRGSEKHAEKLLGYLKPSAFVQIADFFTYSVAKAAQMGFSVIVLSCFFGKLCKWALRHDYTHAAAGMIDFSMLAGFAATGEISEEFREFVKQANTCREIYESNIPQRKEFIDIIGRRALDWAASQVGQSTDLKIYCWSYDGGSFHAWGRA